MHAANVGKGQSNRAGKHRRNTPKTSRKQKSSAQASDILR